MPDATDTAHIVDTLAEQLDCYRRLADLGRRQGDLIATGQTAVLLDLLKDRQAQTTRAAECEQALAPFKRQWADRRQAFPDADRQRVEAMLGEAKRLLADLTQRDEQDALALRGRLGDADRERRQTLREQRDVRRVNRHYAAGAYAAAGRVDFTK